jgi:hypothetical protein
MLSKRPASSSKNGFGHSSKSPKKQKGQNKMASTNKYGLSRVIPADIAREIRKRCGFGCVNCGSALYHYEHMIPEFSEASQHIAEKITLLCGTCHDYVTRGI